MTAPKRTSGTPPPPRWYRGADVPLRVIRRFARQVAEQFHPDKIILFGSHAYGIPHADSDVDILVVMPARNEIDQSVRACAKRCPPLAASPRPAPPGRPADARACRWTPAPPSTGPATRPTSASVSPIAGAPPAAFSSPQPCSA